MKPYSLYRAKIKLESDAKKDRYEIGSLFVFLDYKNNDFSRYIMIGTNGIKSFSNMFESFLEYI